MEVALSALGLGLVLVVGALVHRYGPAVRARIGRDR